MGKVKALWQEKLDEADQLFADGQIDREAYIQKLVHEVGNFNISEATERAHDIESVQEEGPEDELESSEEQP